MVKIQRYEGGTSDLPTFQTNDLDTSLLLFEVRDYRIKHILRFTVFELLYLPTFVYDIGVIITPVFIVKRTENLLILNPSSNFRSALVRYGEI